MVTQSVAFAFVLFLSYFINFGHFYNPNYQSWILERYEENLSRREAKKHCEQNGGHLAIFYNKKSVDSIVHDLNGKHYL